jgi:hypothetical protein
MLNYFGGKMSGEEEKGFITSSPMIHFMARLLVKQARFKI